MTFKQAPKRDAHICKGEKTRLLSTQIASSEKKPTGDDIDREIPFVKEYTVFNGEQIEGLPGVFYAKAARALDLVTPIEHGEEFFSALGATMRHGGNRAF
jgi:antirestriction protein ArdC